MDLEKLKNALQKARIAFSERPASQSDPATITLVVQRVGYALSITPTIYYHGPVVEIRPSGGPRISFHSSKDPAELVAVLDTFVQVRKLAARLQPKWATRQIALITGRNPGSPVLVYEPCCVRIAMVPRPASFNQLHKHSPVMKYEIGASPKRIAADLIRLHQQNTPKRSWESVVADWNCQHSASFGHELTLSAAYIYAWNGMRFLLDGDDLSMDVWGPVFSGAFPEAIRLLESVQAVLGKAVKDREGGRTAASEAVPGVTILTETPSN